MTEDDQLMIDIQSGDTSAFDVIVERHQQSLIGFFFKNTRDIGLSEDLTQETLLKVFNQAWDYLPLGRFRGWLFRIARNLLIDDVRRRSSDALLKAYKGSNPDDADAMARIEGDFVSVDTKLKREELQSLVDELLAELPDDQRQTFTLHHFADLPLAEVAIIMETSEATTKSRLRLAREKLSEKLTFRGITSNAV